MLHEAETWVALAFVAVRRRARLYRRPPHARQVARRARRPHQGRARRGAQAADDAAQLLADYQRKRQEAEREAQDILAGAKAEAERLAVEAKAKVEEFVARRTKMAEVKIAQAEAQAAADVRAAAADAAVAAAEKILAQQAKGPLAGELIAKGIDDVRKKLN